MSSIQIKRNDCSLVSIVLVGQLGLLCDSHSEWGKKQFGKTKRVLKNTIQRTKQLL